MWPKENGDRLANSRPLVSLSLLYAGGLFIKTVLSTVRGGCLCLWHPVLLQQLRTMSTLRNEMKVKSTSQATNRLT